MELVPLFQDLSPTSLNERIEFRCELGHAIPQVLKAEVDTGKRVGHGGRIGR